MRRGFSLFFAIFFLLIMAIVGYMIMTFSVSNVKHTTTSFLDTKAEIYLRSANEFAIMALQGHDFSKGDLDEINITYPGFVANVKFFYFRNDCKNQNCAKIDTKDTNMSTLIYITLTSINNNFRIRKVKVTLQNP